LLSIINNIYIYIYIYILFEQNTMYAHIRKFVDMNIHLRVTHYHIHSWVTYYHFRMMMRDIDLSRAMGVWILTCFVFFIYIYYTSPLSFHPWIYLLFVDIVTFFLWLWPKSLDTGQWFMEHALKWFSFFISFSGLLCFSPYSLRG